MATPLTEAQIEQIKMLHEQGFQQIEIARKIGCSGPTVTRRLQMMNLKAHGRGGVKGNKTTTPPVFVDVPLRQTGQSQVAIVICKPSQVKEILGEL